MASECISRIERSGEYVLDSNDESIDVESGSRNLSTPPTPLPISRPSVMRNTTISKLHERIRRLESDNVAMRERLEETIRTTAATSKQFAKTQKKLTDRIEYLEMIIGEPEYAPECINVETLINDCEVYF